MTGLFLCIVMVLTLVACVTDWRDLRIPNWISAAISLLFVVAFVVSPASFGPWWSHFGAGAVMLAATIAMFAAGHFGGGDAKLASALCLWLGLAGIVPFVLFMGIAGGVLGLFALYIKKKRPFAQPRSEGWIAKVQAGGNALPYGIAISFGFAVAIFHTPVMLQHLHEVFLLIT